MAKQSSKANSKPAWQPRRSAGGLPGVIALIGIVALALTWFAQSSPFLTGSRKSHASGLRISEVMTSNASTLVGDDAGIVDWIELENTSDRAIDLTGYAQESQFSTATAAQIQGLFA